VHIRVQDEISWTYQLMKAFAQMGPGLTYFKLDRNTAQGKQPGKILGPSGEPMLHIDGPHSAPTQHIGEYETVMVVGGGIGVTPVSSTLKSVVYHRWKSAIGKVFPNSAYFYWVISWKDVDCFRWLVRIIKDVQDELVHMRATSGVEMAKHKIEFHIWVTSVPEPQPNVHLEVEDECGLWGVAEGADATDQVQKHRAPFSALDLYAAMKLPDKYSRLGDVHIRKGRPNWGDAFKNVATAHPEGDVGVLFCGNPAIAADLEYNCYASSHNRRGGMFTLHQENF